MKVARETVYTADSVVRHPLRLLREMWQDLLGSSDLAWRLMIRDLKAQYRDSLLGWCWAFLPPLAVTVTFTLAREGRVIAVGPTPLPYPAYVLVGMLLWQVFWESLNAPLQAVTLARPMLTKVNFPREALVLGKLGEVIVQMGLKAVFVIGVLWWYDVPVTISALWALVAVLPLMGLGTLAGLLLAPFGALSQDVPKGVALASGLWLLFTPVVYPPPTGEGRFATLVRVNPVTPLLTTVRDLLTGGTVTDGGRFLMVSAAVGVGLLLAWIAYRAAMPYVVERLGAS